MLRRLLELSSGFRFRLLALIAVFGFAVFAALQVVDTSFEVRQAKVERLADAKTLASVTARSLVDNFAKHEYEPVRNILAAVSSREEVMKITVVDRELTFMSDDRTAKFEPIPVSVDNQMQMKSLKSGRTEWRNGPDGIEVAEPIVADGFREHILKTPGQEFALVLYQKDGLEVVRGNSYGPICFYVSDIDAALSRAEAAGGKSTGPVQSFGPVKYVFLETPDGHVVELIERPD